MSVPVTRDQTRYKGVWDSGYRAGLDDATSSLYYALRDGYTFTTAPGITFDLLVRSPDRERIWSTPSLGTLPHITRTGR